jgi:SAM-dependent MidA family methyltransferase
VTFARFMEMALAHPTLGYYSRPGRLLGYGGDFNTAPALSPFFNRALARLVTELVDVSLASAPCSCSEKPAVVELGGGEGQLAEAVLRSWGSERPGWRTQIAYRIVEVGAGLRRQQADTLAEPVAGGWDVGWGSALGEACAGVRPVVIVGNEFLDTIPVSLIRVGGTGLRESYVTVEDQGLVPTWGEVSSPAATEIEGLFGTLDPGGLGAFTEDGVIEVFPGSGDLLRQVAETMPVGSFVNIDYGEWFLGVPRTGESWGLEGRMPRRRTVRGYFKQQLVLDLLDRAGQQDLTADVDFAALDFHGRQRGFETILFTTLARFLLGGGAEDEMRRLRGERPAPTSRSATAARPQAPTAAAAETPAAVLRESDPLEADRQATVLQNLLDEGDLGGAFKLMIQVRE